MQKGPLTSGSAATFTGAACVVLVFGIVPLLFVLLRAVTNPGEFTATLGNPSVLEAATGTLRLALYTTGIAVVLGAPLAWLTTRTDVPGRRAFSPLLTIPYIVPPYVAAVAWIQLANPQAGYLNQWFGAGTVDIYSMTGLAWVLGLSFYPYVFLTVRSVLENADPSLEDAARMSGAGTWRVLKDVSFPLMRSAVLSSAGLVFMVSASAFGAPALIGTVANERVLSTYIFEELMAWGPDAMARVAGLSCLLFAFVLIPLVLRSRAHATLGGKATRRARLPLGAARAPLGILLALFVLVAIVLPALAVIVSSFLRVGTDLSPSNFTLEHFALLLRGDTLDAVLTSLWLAALAATLAVLVGGIAAFFRTRAIGGRVLATLTALPLATPGTVLAIGLILFWAPFGVANTIWVLLIAYVAKYAALAMRPVGEGLATVDPALPDAARMSGARGVFLVRTIWVPLILPSIMAGWFLVFMPCFSELTMSVLLVSPGIETVGTRLFELIEYEAPAAANVLATVVLVLVVGSNILLRVLSRGRYGV
ncbi:MAG: iron ABC transporter permease [Planctomycetota bacterium]|nr:iron ABC transporter permease [Planctomycetota bacterium]